MTIGARNTNLKTINDMNGTNEAYLEQYKAYNKMKNMTHEERFDYLTVHHDITGEPVSRQPEPWEMLIACNVIGWAFKECVNDGTLPSNPSTGNIVGRIQEFLKSSVYDECGCKPVGQCTVEELERELYKRYETTGTNVRRG